MTKIYVALLIPVPAVFDVQPQDETYLTVVVNSEGHIGSDDVIEANLAVLRGAVGVQSLHAHNSVKQTPLWDGRLVATLDKHRGELIDVVNTNMHGGPEGGGRRGKQRERERDGQAERDYCNDRRHKWLESLYIR